MLTEEPVLPEVSSSRYTIKLAKTKAEFQAALRLRYEIFEMELDRGSGFNSERGIEKDRFDNQFHHLIVIENGTGEIVGTYRLQTYEQAVNALGFTTGLRFQLQQFPEDMLKNAVEVGRAGIAREHRNGRVLYLLWKGLAAYLNYFNKRYIFGYAALDSKNPNTAYRTYDYLKLNNHFHSNFWVEMKPEFIEPWEWPHPDDGQEINIPLLFQSYLNVGSKVCGGPSFDENVMLIHFLILLDVSAVPDSAKATFLE